MEIRSAPHAKPQVKAENSQSMMQKIISSANKKILFLPHAIKQMSRPDRIITTDEIRDATLFGEVIE